MPPSLTTEMTLKGPQVLLSTLTKHYFGTQDSDSTANEELLYASGFRLVKVSSLATLFSNLTLCLVILGGIQQVGLITHSWPRVFTEEEHMARSPLSASELQFARSLKSIACLILRLSVYCRAVG